MEKNFNNKHLYKLVILIGIVAAIVLNLTFVLKYLGKFMSMLSPIFIGCFMAYVLNLIVVPLEKIYFPNSKNKYINKSRRGICILLSILLIILICYIILSIIVPKFYNFIVMFAEKLPVLIDSVRDFLINHSKDIPAIDDKILNKNFDAQKIMDGLNNIFNYLKTNVISFAGSVFGVGTIVVMAIIIAIYILASKETLKRQFMKLFKRFLPEKLTKKIYYVLDITNDSFKAFITGQFIEAIILGALCTVGMFIFRFPYAPMVGSFIGFTALIPMIGAYIGGGFGFLMILSQDPVKAFLFIIFLVILQQFEGNVIYPKVVGGSVGLPGLWILVAVILGGGIYGVVGIFLSVPITATIYKLLKNEVNQVNKKEENFEIKAK